MSESCDLDGNTNQYRYDKLGQLVRASVRNDPTCGANGTTWVYTYDQGGNILKKEGYPKLVLISDELPETPTKVIEYTYDTEWKDLLVSYRDTPGQAKPIQYTPDTLPQMPDGMTYFHMGNPYKHDGWTYEWQAGRQLKSMTHKNEQGVQDKKLEFAYDAAGLRTQKKYTYTDTQGRTVIETTDYILHGKLLTHQKTTTTVDGVQQEPYQLHFYYDAASRPIMVRVGNVEAECKYYSYVHSLQGDILGIIDREQDLVVEYKYDPWGKPLETRSLKTECEELAKLNPFRYRGYIYDDELSIYYLRARYYSFELGRFLNKDSLIRKRRAIFCHNGFAYCKNNPVIMADPDGTIEDFNSGFGSNEIAIAMSAINSVYGANVENTSNKRISRFKSEYGKNTISTNRAFWYNLIQDASHTLTINFLLSILTPEYLGYRILENSIAAGLKKIGENAVVKLALSYAIEDPVIDSTKVKDGPYIYQRYSWVETEGWGIFITSHSVTYEIRDYGNGFRELWLETSGGGDYATMKVVSGHYD